MTAPIYKMNELIDITALAKRWGLQPRTIYNYTDFGKLPFFKARGRRHIPLESVYEFEIENQIAIITD